MSTMKFKDFATLIVVGAWLLVPLSACENSKHAEIMSTEDSRAQAQLGTVPDDAMETESSEGGLPFFAPEPPSSPVLPSGDEIAADPEGAPPAAVLVPAQAPVLPAGSTESSPASASEVAEEPVPAAEPAAEPEMAIAKLEPSDFVPEAPELADGRGDAIAASMKQAEDSGLADIFFDFDRYVIRAGAVPVLEKNAELLKQTYNNSNVLIEGHCDERGTGEYNLELGKRRAQALKEYLVDLGIDESRIQIASYGKERPFCAESTPACWQQNRRGHFVRQVLLSSSSQGE